MKHPSFHDVEQLSAYLDGQLSQVEKTRLEARLQSDPALGTLLGDIRSARLTLKSTPIRAVPRNFTLNPRMLGIHPPVPRLVPALSFASAVAAFIFIITLGSSLLGQTSLNSAAPMLAAAPMTSQESGSGPGFVDATTKSAQTNNTLNTPTPEALLLMAPQATSSFGTRTLAPQPAPKSPNQPVNIWLFVWPGLAVLLLGSALILRWFSVRAFHRRLNIK